MAGRPMRRAQAIAQQPETRIRLSSPQEAEVFVATIRGYGFPAFREGTNAVAYAPRQETRWAELMAQGRRDSSSRRRRDVARPPSSFPLTRGYRFAVRPYPFGKRGRELQWHVFSERTPSVAIGSGEATDIADAQRQARRVLSRGVPGLTRGRDPAQSRAEKLATPFARQMRRKGWSDARILATFGRRRSSNYRPSEREARRTDKAVDRELGERRALEERQRLVAQHTAPQRTGLMARLQRAISRDPQRPSAKQREFISEKIRILRREGYEQRQAIAIAHRMAGVPPRGIRRDPQEDEIIEEETSEVVTSAAAPRRRARRRRRQQPVAVHQYFFAPTRANRGRRDPARSSRTESRQSRAKKFAAASRRGFAGAARAAKASQAWWLAEVDTLMRTRGLTYSAADARVMYGHRLTPQQAADLLARGGLSHALSSWERDPAKQSMQFVVQTYETTASPDGISESEFAGPGWYDIDTYSSRIAADRAVASLKRDGYRVRVAEGRAKHRRDPADSHAVAKVTIERAAVQYIQKPSWLNAEKLLKAVQSPRAGLSPAQQRQFMQQVNRLAAQGVSKRRAKRDPQDDEIIEEETSEIVTSGSAPRRRARRRRRQQPVAVHQYFFAPNTSRARNAGSTRDPKRTQPALELSIYDAAREASARGMLDKEYVHLSAAELETLSELRARTRWSRGAGATWTRWAQRRGRRPELAQFHDTLERARHRSGGRGYRASGRDPISAAQRRALPKNLFALPARRALPIDTAARTRNAAARLAQMKNRGTVTPAEFARARFAIPSRYKELGIGQFAGRRRSERRGQRRVAADPQGREGPPAPAGLELAGGMRGRAPAALMTEREARRRQGRGGRGGRGDRERRMQEEAIRQIQALKLAELHVVARFARFRPRREDHDRDPAHREPRGRVGTRTSEERKLRRAAADQMWFDEYRRLVGESRYVEQQARRFMHSGWSPQFAAQEVMRGSRRGKRDHS